MITTNILLGLVKPELNSTPLPNHTHTNTYLHSHSISRHTHRHIHVHALTHTQPHTTTQPHTHTHTHTHTHSSFLSREKHNQYAMRDIKSFTDNIRDAEKKKELKEAQELCYEHMKLGTWQ